ncbi:MAG: hypothetical protein HZA89_09095 [Verrucomicrobia bacterium]|nr:hypothetical protein [Verrucomicrobiota bacterium]
MGAIPNSVALPRLSVGGLLLPCCLVLLLMAGPARSQTNTSAFAARAEKIYQAEKQRFQAEPTNSVAAWQFARACFDWAEFAAVPQRAAIAEEGIAAGRQATLRAPTIATGHYYLAMNLGRLADTKRNLSGLRMVNEMESVFKLAAALDPKLDFAGPDRGLGLLHLQAPGWPISVGSKSKARTHLQRAVELAPDYPDNRLNLIEALLKWGDKKGLPREVAAFEAALPEARKKFSGEDWAASWADWDKRWNRAQKKAREVIGASAKP